MPKQPLISLKYLDTLLARRAATGRFIALRAMVAAAHQLAANKTR